jgi:hypothetical protein
MTSRKWLLVALVPLTILVSGCEGFQANQSWLHNLGPRIQRNADKTCAERGGTANIMLATDRQDDGIVTCQDGSNHLFDL